MSTPPPAPSAGAESLRFLSAPGAMAERIRCFDWAGTSLGEPQHWPTSLRTTVGMMLKTRHPVFIFWGPELLCLYNDAYSASLGPEKHPGILGRPGRQAFPELWHLIGPDIEQVLSGGPATWHEDKLVPSFRNGTLDEVYWTYSYGGIDDEQSPHGVGGVLVLCNETTAQVLERRRTQSEFERMAGLFEQAPIFMARLAGPEHRFEFANAAYRRLVGGRDVVGQSVLQALPELAEQGYVKRLDEVYTTGRAYRAMSAPVALARRGHEALEERRLDFVYQPTLDRLGHIDGVLVVGVDVTDRFQIEKALEFRSEQLRLATDAGEVGFWDVDLLAGTLYWPESVRKMFGVFSDRPVSLEIDFREGLHPQDREATVAAFTRAIDPRLRVPYDVEYRTIGWEDGRVRWVAAKGRGLFDGQGRCVRIIGTAIDITARKSDEARLKELNETLEKRLGEYLAERKLFADVVESTDALIQVLDTNFIVLANNKVNATEFERLYGVKPRVGDNLLALIRHLPVASQEIQRVWSRALAGESFIEEIQFGDPSRVRSWYEIHFHPLYSASGSLLGACQIGYDVTLRHQTEARLAETEAALQQAQRMESVGLLTGGIAHDFNNVLQAVNTKFELIRRRPEDVDRVRHWAASGAEIALKGARVTAQLLAFSKQRPASDRPVRLRDVLNHLRDLLQTTLGTKIKLRIDSPDAWVQGDQTQFEMALLNLAVNSRDAMPQGGSFSITVTEAGDTVQIAVADTGCGMSPELIAKAFTPFFTTKAMGKGSGLGLAQVYATAQRVGGSVRIDSDGSTGTTVVITLLRAEAPTSGSEVPSRSANTRAARSPIHILVVDDEAPIRQSLADLLRSQGHRVTEAAGGEQALTGLERASVDLLLCDFAMPGMNGVALANLARALHPSLPVIFMSGYAEGDELLDAVGQSGLLLRKPFDADAVQGAIEQAVARQGRAGDAD